MYEDELQKLSSELKELSAALENVDKVIVKQASSKKLNSEYVLDFIKFFVK